MDQKTQQRRKQTKKQIGGYLELKSYHWKTKYIYNNIFDRILIVNNTGSVWDIIITISLKYDYNSALCSYFSRQD